MQDLEILICWKVGIHQPEHKPDGDLPAQQHVDPPERELEDGDVVILKVLAEIDVRFLNNSLDAFHDALDAFAVGDVVVAEELAADGAAQPVEVGFDHLDLGGGEGFELFDFGVLVVFGQDHQQQTGDIPHPLGVPLTRHVPQTQHTQKNALDGLVAEQNLNIEEGAGDVYLNQSFRVAFRYIVHLVKLPVLLQVLHLLVSMPLPIFPQIPQQHLPYHGPVRLYPVPWAPPKLLHIDPPLVQQPLRGGLSFEKGRSVVLLAFVLGGVEHEVGV